MRSRLPLTKSAANPRQACLVLCCRRRLTRQFGDCLHLLDQLASLRTSRDLPRLGDQLASLLGASYANRMPDDFAPRGSTRRFCICLTQSSRSARGRQTSQFSVRANSTEWYCVVCSVRRGSLATAQERLVAPVFGESTTSEFLLRPTSPDATARRDDTDPGASSICSVCGRVVAEDDVENTSGWRWYSDGRGGLRTLCATCPAPSSLS